MNVVFQFAVWSRLYLQSIYYSFPKEPGTVVFAKSSLLLSNNFLSASVKYSGACLNFLSYLILPLKYSLEEVIPLSVVIATNPELIHEFGKYLISFWVFHPS